ncbi:MAG: cytidylate kinase-like family protein [Anaerolineae bacterium]|nr:cytidylate kinase-like family protein [Anaerolineae bacterium]
MPAITLSRELGSLGTDIARSLADGLGYRMMWREVINEAACRACAPEVALAVIDDLGLLGLRPSNKAQRAYLQSVRQVIEQLAAEGNVIIVGRAGQIILRGYPDVLHVRITAPLALRVERIAARHTITSAAAKARVESSDRARTTYVQRHYQVDWNDPKLYDLVINTETIPVQLARDLIARTWEQRLQETSTSSSPS